MLYGTEPERLRKMRTLGHQIRVYLLYSREWYLYLCRRLAKYPPTICLAVFDANGALEGRS